MERVFWFVLCWLRREAHLLRQLYKALVRNDSSQFHQAVNLGRDGFLPSVLQCTCGKSFYLNPRER